MNFDFSDECKQIAAELRRALSNVCTMDEVRRCLNEARSSRETWQTLADLGVLGAAIPEQWGGSGLTHLELAICAEEIGRACAPIPTLPSLYLACEGLLTSGTVSQRERWLPEMARGNATGSVVFEPDGCKWTDGRISGVLPIVPAGMQADFIIVAIGENAHLVELAQSGVVRESLRAIDPGYPIAKVKLDSVVSTTLEGSLIHLADRAAVLLAFEQLGGAERALEMACHYAKLRYCFGRPIGSYQAIKAKLADVYVKNQLARAHAYYGAWALTTGAPTLPLAAAGARVAATVAFELAAQENLQVHGGIGFTWEADCHPLYKRARSLALALGTTHTWSCRLVEHLRTSKGCSDELR